jgi:hypothetical protein
MFEGFTRTEIKTSGARIVTVRGGRALPSSTSFRSIICSTTSRGNGATGGVGRNHKPMEIWPHYASDIRGGKALPCGHYLSDEAPEETYRELREFFAVADPEKA